MSTRPHAFEEVEYNAPSTDTPDPCAVFWEQQERERMDQDAAAEAEVEELLREEDEEDASEREPENYDPEDRWFR